MENETSTKRGWVLILVVATVAVFVGLVWLIATFVPWNRLGLAGPSATASERAERNCTYPISYWKVHPELYPPQVVIGGEVYEPKDLIVILSDGTQNPAQQIQAQLAGVFLNSLAGADQSSIEITIFEAYGWLVQHPGGSQVTDSDLEKGTRLFNVLEAYNLGLAGVVPCEAAFSITLTGTSTATGTPTFFSSITPSQTTTPTLSETPAPTGQIITPIDTVIVPSQTPIPTTGEPGLPSLTPSRTPASNPTNTPVNTTEAPPPTSTSTTIPTIPHSPTPIPPSVTVPPFPTP